MNQKLGYFVPQFPGQTHIFFWREINAMQNMGVTPVLFSTTKPPKGLIAHDWSDAAMSQTQYIGAPRFFDFWAGLMRLPFREINKLAGTQGLSVWKDAIICASAANRLKSLCKSQKIEHVHIHSCARAALIGALSKHMGGPTYSISLHGPLSDYGTAQSYKWRNASFATIITKKLLAQMQTDLPDDLPARLVIQPMGVDTDDLKRTAPYVPYQLGQSLKLFSCGRLNVVKGHQDLMKAVQVLRDQGVDATLEIAGQDDLGGAGYHLELQAEIIRLGLQDHVTLLGAIDAQAVRRKLLEAHIFVLASWHEPLGVAYMEAMSCEVPTIGTNAGGVPELITDGQNGIMVPPKDPQALAGAISKLSKDPDYALKLSTAGRAHIVQNFQSAKGAQTLVDESFRD